MLQEVLIDEMQDLLHAENQLVKALPKMAKAANSDELSNAFKEHLEQTKGHVERLKKAFEMLGVKEKNETDADIELIAAAQRVEHYEVSAYGTCRTIAEQLNRKDIAELLSQT